jgi:hypothetical protein
VERFARFFNKGPDRPGPEEIRIWQAHLLHSKKLLPMTVVTQVAALRFFYRRVLKRRFPPDSVPYLTYTRHRLPTVSSPEEVTQLIEASGRDCIKPGGDHTTGRAFRSCEDLAREEVFDGVLDLGGDAFSGPHVRARVASIGGANRNRTRGNRPEPRRRQERAPSDAGSRYPDTGRSPASGSQALLRLWPKARHQRSTNSVCANRFWRGSRIMPPLSALPLPGRQTNHGLANRYSAIAEYNAGASVPLCSMGQQGTVPSSVGPTGRTASHRRWQCVTRYAATPCPHSGCST